MNFSIKFEYASSVVIYVYYLGKKYRKSTGIKCDKKHFNPKAQNFNYVHHKDGNSLFKNQELRNEYLRIEKGLIILYGAGILSANTIRVALESKNETDIYSLQAIGRKYISERITNYGTARRYRYYLAAWNELYPDMLISQITMPILHDMLSQLTMKYKGSNTVLGYFKFLRTLVNFAIKIGVNMEYPFGRHKFILPRYNQTKRNYLTESEVTKIEKLKISNPTLNHVRNYFLFGCYCGMRYSDVMEFNLTWIRDNKLYFSDKKTKTAQYVPLYPKLLKMAKIIAEQPKYSNQEVNRQLKIIQELVSVSFGLTFHVSRHSFSMLYLNKGGSMAVLSKLLGHKKITTTEIYGSISDIRIDSEFGNIME